VLRVCAALPVLLFPFVSDGADNSSRTNLFAVSVSSDRPGQGDPVIVEFTTAYPMDNVSLIWKGRMVPMKEIGIGLYMALIGIDAAEPPGEAAVSIHADGEGPFADFSLMLTVEEKAFPVQELTLPKRMAEFDNVTLDRIRTEAERLENLFAVVTPASWDFPFLPPVADYRPTNFGARRIINGEPRSQHAAVDLNVPEGTPVTAIAAGAVAFAGEQFFGGLSVVLDHGGGLFSVYYHLRDFSVKEGRRVERGERIGSVGATGRATGPHLHFGVRAPGGRIDPSKLFEQAFH
jgi:murein DD-endopeptidase MepM/ murein hydrolase activator NlpD